MGWAGVFYCTNVGPMKLIPVSMSIKENNNRWMTYYFKTFMLDEGDVRTYVIVPSCPNMSTHVGKLTKMLS